MLHARHSAFVCLAMITASTVHAQDPYSLNMTQIIGFSCSHLPLEPSCAELNHDGIGDYGSPIAVWVLVGDVPAQEGTTGGIGGLQFGIHHETNATNVHWALCTGGGEIPQNDINGVWPDSDTGNALTWGGGCQPEGVGPDRMTRVGYFTLQISDDPTGAFWIRDDPRTGRTEVADCATTLFEICDPLRGALALDAGSGTCDDVVGRPCDVCGASCQAVPTLEATWTGLKSHYRDTP